MGTVLGGMRNVRWHELQHAYGSASQVPGMLSRVAWGDGPTAGDALGELARWIGAPAAFDGTVAAVPFLWELAGTETVKDRAGVLGLLTTILAAGHAERPEWARAAHEAVAEGRPTAVRLTAGASSPPHADPVREAATRLLTALDGHSCPACPPSTA
ncbi:hypothetical protein ACWEJZ_12150 [Streptomyces bacillaris]